MSVNGISHLTYIFLMYVKILPQDFFPFSATFSCVTEQRFHCHDIFMYVDRQMSLFFFFSFFGGVGRKG